MLTMQQISIVECGGLEVGTWVSRYVFALYLVQGIPCLIQQIISWTGLSPAVQVVVFMYGFGPWNSPTPCARHIQYENCWLISKRSCLLDDMTELLLTGVLNKQMAV